MTVSSAERRRVRRLLAYLGLQRGTAGVLLTVVLMGMGEHMSERFLPIYLTALGGGALAVGGLQALDNLLSALYSLPGGYLAERIGAKRALLVFSMAAMLGFAVVIAIPAWQAVLAGAVLFIAWSAISMPATISLMYQSLAPERRTMGVTMHSLVRRVPMALGPVLGGILIGIWGERDGVRLALAAALVMAGVALVLQQRLITEEAKPLPGAGFPAALSPARLVRLMDSPLRRLLAADILIRFCEQIPYAFVVIWCMQSIPEPVSAVRFGVLTSIEMATAALVYIPVAHWADRTAKKPFVLATFVFFTLFPLVLLFSRSFPWLVVAFVLRGLKEFGEPTRKVLILDLAPEQHRAGMFGLYYLIRDVVVSAAALGGAFLWQISPQTNFLAAFGFGLLGTLGFAVWGRDLPSMRPGPQLE